MPALYGIRLALDESSANALAPWLDAGPELSASPIVSVEVLAKTNEPPPAVLEVVRDEPTGWLGRTASGLMLGNHEGAWFAIEASPLRIRGVMGDGSERARQLLLGALQIQLRAQGIYGVHAAAISLEQHGILLIGESGAGKSTTTTALVNAGCRYLGDDLVLIRERLGNVELLAFWSSFRLTEHSLGSFESLKPYSHRPVGNEKWSLNTLQAFPNRFMSHWLGRKTLLFLERAEASDSSLLPITQADALGLLISQSQMLSLECHPDPRRHLDLLAHLVRISHVARLQLGTEWLTDPDGAARRFFESAQSFSQPREQSIEGF